MEVKQKQRVSEFITLKDIESWSPKEVITISAGTGVGKSYFIKNNLYEYAKQQGKKILFLLHRKNAITQFEQELKRDKKEDVIDIKTYQSIKEKCKYEEEYDFSSYGYIVSDEFHYFLKDAELDRFIDLSLTAILEQSHCVKIFMSATGDSMRKYLSFGDKLPTKNYELKTDYNFINKMFFYYKKESLENILNQFKQENKKAIIFTSAKEAYDLHKKYINRSIFNCSESNEYYKYVNIDKINEIFEKEKFDELFLFTTTTMDTGVNIVDSSLQTIICDLYSVDDIEQCIGRKRLINDDDYINLYVRAKTKNEIETRQNIVMKVLDKAKYLMENGEEAFLKKYPRDIEYTGIYYMEYEEGKINLKINDLVLGSTYLRIDEYENILKYGYKGCIASWLGRTYLDGEYDYIDYDSVVNREKLLTILESYKDKLLYGTDKEEFLVELYACGFKKNAKAIGKVESYLKSLGIVEYVIKPKRIRDIDSNGKEYRPTKWVVKKKKR
ncbi:DEAD/DEAH box helicase family protein [Lysinibacillus xylanilyticus]|uniref:DEAD/DEAH box helicase family protein n=1 Tax=Lysinibacillus xylanilyticus TaxID=582475 RepID=UPI003823EEB5